MKAILVIDETPKKCYDCQLMTDDMYCKGFTPYYTEEGIHITRRCVEDYVMHGDRHPNCPLKPLPEKKNEKDVEKIYSINDRSWTNGFSDGYNYCIDELLGEKDG